MMVMSWPLAVSLIMSDPDRAFEDLMNRMLYRIHQYNTILKVCVVIVSEGPVYTNIQNTKVNI
jgi:hypothetical protein